MRIRNYNRSTRVECTFIFLAFATILAITGCSTSRQPDVQVIDLLALLPPDKSIELDNPSSPRMIWDFDHGLPEGWTAGPEGVEIRSRSGGILLESPDGSPTWVEMQVTVDPLHYQQVLAVVEPRTGRPAFLLHYAFDDPPRYSRSNRIRVGSDPDRGQQLLQLRLPTPGAIGRPIQALRLYTGGGSGTAVLKRLVIQPRQEDILEELVFSQSRVGLGHDHRHCWRIPGNDFRKVTLRLPKEDPRLSFALGTLRSSDPAILTVEVLKGETLLGQAFQRAFPLPGTGWHEAQVDLSPWRGEEISLRFSIHGGGPQSIRLIGTPVIRTVPCSPRPSVLLIAIDAQRADRFSLYGHHKLTSPHLARLAGEGILFSTTAAPCSWTIPSVAATFTGRYADAEQLARGHGGSLTDHTTLAQRFSNAGYATGGFTANFLLTDTKGFARVFEAWYVTPHHDSPTTTEELNLKALRWLRAHRDEETFCYIHYMDPHAPYDAPWPESPPPQ